jgi:hypothetical protein
MELNSANLYLFAIKIDPNGKHDVTLVPVTALEALEATHSAAPEMINLEQRTATLEAKVETISSSSGYFSIKAWARLNRQPMPNPRAKAIGKACAQLCRSRGLEIGKARDEAFGEVNTYPESVIAEVVRAQADLGFLGR